MSISKMNRAALTVAALLVASGQTGAQVASPGVVKDIGAVASPDVPGFSRAVMPGVTPEESERVIHSRTLPARLNPGVIAPARKAPATNGVAAKSAARVGGDASAAAPASIAELARALRNNPDLIYEYVRNNIEYVPMWGVKKGALGTVLDNQGTAFDQATLMVELLRQSGITASYIKGRISLTGAQVNEWFGGDNPTICGTLNVIANGQIPYANPVASGAGSCPTSTATLTSVDLDHVWVKAVIAGTAYYFDPSYKPHTRKVGIDLVAATAYSATGYLNTVRSGATITADYAQNINRTGIRDTLTTYSNNLAAYVRTNKPAAALEDVLGGTTITPYSGAALRQTTLPYQNTSVAVTEWTDVPALYKPTLQIQYPGIDVTYTSDAIYGKRLSITSNASNQPVLMLDGTAVATGSVISPGTNQTIVFRVLHGAYASANSNQNFSQSIKAGGTFVVANSWGPAGRGMTELHRLRLADARASGAADGSEVALGSSLAMLASNWVAQTNQLAHVQDKIARTTTFLHHQIGIAGYTTAPYVDLPGNKANIVARDADATKEGAAFFNLSMHSSILESTAVQQSSGVSAVSTVKLLDIASQAGQKIFAATSANYAASVRPFMQANCSAPQLDAFANTLNQSAAYRLILPSSCALNEASWTGLGYYQILVNGTQYAIGAAIGGNLLGGFGTTNLSTPQMNAVAEIMAYSPANLVRSSGSQFGDPIDMVKGQFLYAHDDFTTGTGAFPYGLQFNRLYSSGLRTSAGPLGKGWTHNLAATATTSSNGLQSMGEDSALDAVGSITEMMISLDLLSDATKPIDKMVGATLGHRWFGDQLLSNTVVVTQGLNGEIFTKLTDGTYNAPPGSSAKLIRNADTTYSYETANKAKLNFDLNGKASTYVHPSGVQANFTYTGSDLTQVSNSLGRTLTLTNSSGRITNVSDGVRSVQYGYDGSNNLTSYTDATAKATTFQYDLPGRITQVFNPSNPTIAIATNVYDTLGRVQTQTDANGKLYTYYFAGTRSEEVAPLGKSLVTYLDSDGRVIKAINPTGKVTTNTYDGQTRLIKTVLPEGNSLETDYDDAPCAAQLRCTHNVKTVRQIAKPGSGLTTLTQSFTYESAFNRVASATDARSQVTSFTYTAQGLPLATTSPADAGGVQPVTTYGYTSYTASGFPAFYLSTSISQKTSATNTVVTTTSYNAANKYVPQTVVADAGTGLLNLSTALTFDGVGNPTLIDGPRTDVTDTVAKAFDAQRRVTQNTDALGKLTRIAYDADGRVIRSVAQIGTQWLVSCTTYSPSGKPVKSWGPAQTSADTACPTAAAPVPVTDYAYDDLDRLSRTTQYLTVAEGGNRITDTVYNLDDTVASVSRAVGTAQAQTYATYTYTNNGLVATSKDARNFLSGNEYDGFDRKVKSIYPSPTAINTTNAADYEQYTLDNNGNVTTLRKRSVHLVNFTYDNLNRVATRSYPAAPSDNVTFTYDLVGRRLTAAGATPADTVSYLYDNAGRLTSTTAAGRTLSYQVDAAGNRVRTTWPEATPFYVTTAYDALNRPTSISELGTTALASYAYDDLSRRTVVTRGNTSTTTSYGYDNQGALNSLAHNLTGTAQDITTTYTRNQALEIGSATWTNDSYQWAGVLGNVTNGTRTYTVNGLNQYSAAGGSVLSSDANGNLRQIGAFAYVYNLNNRLNKVTKTTAPAVNATLAYDTENRLRQTVINGATVNMLYDGTDMVAEYDAAGTLLRRYVHGPGVDEPLVAYEGTGTTSRYWLYADNLGSIIGSADATGTSFAIYSYGPFGEPNNETGPRFKYSGQQYIAGLGLYYYKARLYSATLGRFLQTDPVGTADDLNLYAYVGNNPVNFGDPTGLMAKDAALLGTKVASSVGDWWEQGVSRLLEGPTRYDFETGINAFPELGLGKAVGLGAVSAIKGVTSVENAAKGVANFSRELQAADLGVQGTLQELKGTFAVKDGLASMRVDMIRGEIKNPLEVVGNMANTARASGATSLKIEGTIANERLFDVLTRRYGLTSIRATDTITIPLK